MQMVQAQQQMANQANAGPGRAVRDSGGGGLPTQGFQGQGSNRQDQPNQVATNQGGLDHFEVPGAHPKQAL